MKLELKDKAGKVIGTIDFPLSEVVKGLGQSSSSSSESVAQLKQENEGNLSLLKESQEKVAKLEEQLTTGARASGSMDDFTPTEKANFVIAWAKGLTPEKAVAFAQHVGFPVAAAQVAEPEGEPKTIQGKTNKPGYKYLDYINISVRE